MPNIHILEFSAIVDETKTAADTNLHPFREHAIALLKTASETKDTFILVSDKFSIAQMETYLKQIFQATTDSKSDARETKTNNTHTNGIVLHDFRNKETKDQKSDPVKQREFFIGLKSIEATKNGVVTYFCTDRQTAELLRSKLSTANIFCDSKPELYFKALLDTYRPDSSGAVGNFNLIKLNYEFLSNRPVQRSFSSEESLADKLATVQSFLRPDHSENDGLDQQKEPLISSRDHTEDDTTKEKNTCTICCVL